LFDFPLVQPQIQMKCVGAEDGQNQCQRCKHAGSEYVSRSNPSLINLILSTDASLKNIVEAANQVSSMFHLSFRAIIEINVVLRLSEAYKIRRRMEKGLHTEKIKSQSADTAVASSYFASDSRNDIAQDLHYSGMVHPNDNFNHGSPSHFPCDEVPIVNLTSYKNSEQYPTCRNGSRPVDMDEDEEDLYRTEVGLFPAKLFRKENPRNSFFRTVLNPEDEGGVGTGIPNHG
jgi:hypothetical protein